MAETYCGGNGCVCGVQTENGRAYCFNEYRCSPTAASSCQTDADCAAQGGAGFICAYDELELCYGTTVCIASDGCANNIPGQKKRELEQVFKNASGANKLI